MYPFSKRFKTVCSTLLSVRNFTLKQLYRPLLKYGVLERITDRIFPLIWVTIKQSETVEIFSVVKMCFKRTRQKEASLAGGSNRSPQIWLDSFIGRGLDWIIFIIPSSAISKVVCSKHQKNSLTIIWSICRFLYCMVIIPEVNTQATYFFPMAYIGR